MNMATGYTSHDRGRFAGIIKEVIGDNHEAVMEALKKYGVLDWYNFARIRKVDIDTGVWFGSIIQNDKNLLHALLRLCKRETMNGNRNVPTIDMFRKFDQFQLKAQIAEENPDFAPPPNKQGRDCKRRRGNGLPKDPIPYTRTNAHTISQDNSRKYIRLLKEKQIFPNIRFPTDWLSTTTNLLGSMDCLGKKMVVVYNLFFGTDTDMVVKTEEILQWAEKCNGFDLVDTLSSFNSRCCDNKLVIENITNGGWGCCLKPAREESCCLVILDLFYHHIAREINEGKGEGHRKTLFLEPRSGLVFPNKDGLVCLYGTGIRKDSSVYVQNLPPENLETEDEIKLWKNSNEDKTMEKQKVELKLQSCFTRFFYPLLNRKGEETQYQREIDINSVVMLTLPGKNNEETESESE